MDDFTTELSKARYMLETLQEKKKLNEEISIIVGDSDIMLAIDPREFGENWYTFARGGNHLEREFLSHGIFAENKFDKIVFGFNIGLAGYLTMDHVTEFDAQLLTELYGISEYIEMVARSFVFSFWDQITIRDSFQRVLLGTLDNFFLSVNNINNIIEKKSFFNLPIVKKDYSSNTCYSRDYLNESYLSHQKQQGFRYGSNGTNQSNPMTEEMGLTTFVNKDNYDIRKHLLFPYFKNLSEISNCVLITVPPKVISEHTESYHVSVENYKKYMEPIIKKFKNIKFLETTWHYHFTNFEDYHHMNKQGSINFTSNIKKALEEIKCGV